ncbi:hypothetical protein DVQ33_03020 [Yersinia enterocolitica]|nr:hypothetical protein [Yersinia enterocolitica]EKN4921242.1 hypothetical protein [Yersinia enterocolitica]EKN4933327.1 hypothetical protein [Yersinia enterocolitica]EKN5020126.1 hypothetical protein [Yersinia enterocolitica]EKN5030555.1 hypothetical protein [Yersinia enterocolitica]
MSLAEYFSSDCGFKNKKMTDWCKHWQRPVWKTHWGNYCEQIYKTDVGRDIGSFGCRGGIFVVGSTYAADRGPQ